MAIQCEFERGSSRFCIILGLMGRWNKAKLFSEVNVFLKNCGYSLYACGLEINNNMNFK